MKKIFKLFSIALTVGALASCSSDDDFQANGFEDVQIPDNAMAAIVEDPNYGDGSTRSAVGYFDYDRFVWTEGDSYKLYARHNWRTDKWNLKSTAKNNTVGVFECGNEGGQSNIVAKDSAYAIFPYSITVDATTKKWNGTNPTEYKSQTADEERTALDIMIPNTWDYEEVVASKNGEGEYTAAKTPLPMWGFAYGNTIKFKYLTAVLVVKLDGQFNTGDATTPITLEVSGDTQANPALAGARQLDVEKEMAEAWDEEKGTVDKDNVPAFVPNTAAASSGNTITITNIPATAKNKYFYVPVVPGKYRNLTVQFKQGANVIAFDGITVSGNKGTVDADKKIVTFGVGADTSSPTYYKQFNAKEFVVITCAMAGATTAWTSTATTLAALNAEIAAKAATASGKLDVTVTNQIKAVDYMDAGTQERVKDSILVIPSFKYDVDITFQGGIKAEYEGVDNTNTSYATAKTMGLIVKNGAQKLTINDQVGSLNKNVITVAENSGSVYFANTGAKTKEIRANAGIVGVTGGMEVANLKANGATTINVEGSAVVDALVANTAAVNVGTASTAYTGTLKATVKTGTTNVWNSNTGTVNVEFADAGTLNLYTGTIAAITIPEGSTVSASNKATVNTYGTSAITSGEKTKVAYNAYYNKEANPTLGIAKTVAGTEAANIYTAAQLLAVVNGQEYNLYATVDFQGAEFNDAIIATLSKSFNGNNNTIKNFILKPATSSTALGLFAKITGSDNLTIKNLNITGVSTKVEAAYAKGIGALAGIVDATAEVNVQNVSINATTLGQSKAATDIAVDKVGGMFGTISGTATMQILDCPVTVAAIKGNSKLGGLIGSIEAAADVTVNTTKSGDAIKKIAVTAFTKMESETAPVYTAGMIGNVVGTISNDGAKFSIGELGHTFSNFVKGNPITSNRVALGYKLNRFLDTTKADIAYFYNSADAVIGFSGTNSGNGANLSAITSTIGTEKVKLFGKTLVASTPGNNEVLISEAVNKFKYSEDWSE